MPSSFVVWVEFFLYVFPSMPSTTQHNTVLYYHHHYHFLLQILFLLLPSSSLPSIWQLILQLELYCVTQLMLYTGDKLSSPIFCCLCVRHRCHPTKSPFSQYIQAKKPFADPEPPNTKQYQLILTKYQRISSYTDPEPSSTTYNSSSRKAQFSQLNNFSFYHSFDESRTVYLV